MDLKEVSEYQYERACLLLPWYVTDKLTLSEKEEIEAILEISPKLRSELTNQQKMAQMVGDDPEVLNIVAIETQEQRLNRLLGRIKRTSNNEPKQQTSIWTGIWAGFPSQVLKSIDTFIQPLSNNWTRVAFSLFLVVQVAILVVVIDKDTDSSFVAKDSVKVDGGSFTADGSSARYDLAGEGVFTPADQTVLVFQFTIQASKNEIDRLFQEIGAQIIEHPAGSTNYTVTLSGLWSEQDIDGLISRLEKNNTMIRLVGRGL